jgi:hypothetical protein
MRPAGVACAVRTTKPHFGKSSAVLRAMSASLRANYPRRRDWLRLTWNIRDTGALLLSYSPTTGEEMQDKNQGQQNQQGQQGGQQQGGGGQKPGQQQQQPGQGGQQGGQNQQGGKQDQNR